MEIRQTVRHGIPVINGIWYLKQQAVVPYRVWDTPAGRRLTPMQQNNSPRFKQQYVYLYQPEIPFPEMNAAFCFGRLRDIRCGYVYFYEPETDRFLWIASFEYAAPFVKGSLHGNRLMLATDDGELWQFDVTEPQNVQISIMQQSGLIRHTTTQSF